MRHNLTFTRSAKKRYAKFMASVLCFALIGGLTGAYLARTAAAEEGQATPYSAVYSSDNPVPAIAERVRPAVVQVINIAEMWSRQTGVTRQEQGYGSGVYIDERGYIVTNYHVIEQADAVEIETLSGERMGAEIVGYDDGTDLAVLRALEPIDAQPVPLGDSDALQIGELAIAIGNPGDSSGVLFGTVTAGIISALDRTDLNANNFTRSVSVIQTDAAINTGNSGGALLNAQGELIGIPTLKITYDYTTIYEGLGFAIPVNTAKPIIEQLISQGKVLRPRLGVSVVNFDGPNEPLKNYPPAGAQVLSLESGSPAEKAGVKLYDIITHINGQRIKTTDELIAEIDRFNVGESVSLTLYRCYDTVTGFLIENPTTHEVDVVLELIG